ncbi:MULTISPECIES: diacylglycerol kinase [unclassified Vibrio]|uniref:diacylglycerol kinase n=1 Tax=unclassified Vibrio TaxID=2614977 RepID=UPI001361C94A|nr:diacylglycerol kinase [Vibrio sp. V36_P2S2PM302]NAX22902.1 diacylglycerol kinase [Vibrio sp. V39_P1S14PM300]NAX24779.1 diacylglycerol kinase [Vibrio sp. V38_P2S17PM301]NAX31159.1 diacylglycerol kinase [Vibrio sp. V37_P2S8PM304]
MTQKAPQGFKRLVNATKYSYQGIKAAFKNEAAFREEVLLSVIMIPTALLLDVTGVERVLLIGTVLLVMVVELLNSAVEAVVDRIGSEHHELAGRAKDMGSAAVLITMLITGYTWLQIIFF